MKWFLGTICFLATVAIAVPVALPDLLSFWPPILRTLPARVLLGFAGALWFAAGLWCVRAPAREPRGLGDGLLFFLALISLGAVGSTVGLVRSGLLGEGGPDQLASMGALTAAGALHTLICISYGLYLLLRGDRNYSLFVPACLAIFISASVYLFLLFL